MDYCKSGSKTKFISKICFIFISCSLVTLLSSNAFSGNKRKVCINNNSGIHIDIKDGNGSWVFDLFPNMGECFSVDAGEAYNKRFTAFKHDTEEAILSHEFNAAPGEEKITWTVE